MKKILLLMISALLSVSAWAQFPEASDYFITKWDTGAGTTLTVMATSAAGISFTVNWEKADDPSTNGSVTYTGITTSTRPTLNLPTSGVYILKIAATTSTNIFSFSTWMTNTATAHTDALKLLEVMQWGTNPWASGASMFIGCKNMDVTATDIPNFSNATLFTYMFYDCSNLIGANQDFNAWAINPTGLGISYMFGKATLFNRPIGNWNVSGNENFARVFYLANAFNQPLNSWNVSNATRFDLMFYGAKAFNQSLSSWSSEKVYNMSQMFYDATAFNQSIANFSLKAIPVNDQNAIYNILNKTSISSSNYSETLIAWAADSNTPNGLRFGVVSAMYTSSAVSARSTLISKGWTITDGGLDPSTALGELATDNQMKVRIENKQLLISNVKDGDLLQLIDVSGRLCGSQSVNNSQAVFRIEKPGAYIIRNITNQKNQKVLL